MKAVYNRFIPLTSCRFCFQFRDKFTQSWDCPLIHPKTDTLTEIKNCVIALDRQTCRRLNNPTRYDKLNKTQLVEKLMEYYNLYQVEDCDSAVDTDIGLPTNRIINYPKGLYPFNYKMIPIKGGDADGKQQEGRLGWNFASPNLLPNSILRCVMVGEIYTHCHQKLLPLTVFLSCKKQQQQQQPSLCSSLLCLVITWFLLLLDSFLNHV